MTLPATFEEAIKAQASHDRVDAEIAWARWYNDPRMRKPTKERRR